MRSGFSSLSFGLAPLPSAIPIIGVATTLPLLVNLLARVAWAQAGAFLMGAYVLAVLVGWVLAWYGGRWLARREEQAIDPRSAVLIAGVLVVSQLARMGEGSGMMVASIAFFSLPSVVAVLAIGRERRLLALREAGGDAPGEAPRLSRRLLVMCLVPLALPLVLMVVVSTIDTASATSRYNLQLCFAGFLALIPASWLLGRLLRRRWPWAPMRPAIAAVPVLLSQWPTVFAATEYRATLLAALACAFLLPCLAFLLGFGVFRRAAPDAAIP